MINSKAVLFKAVFSNSIQICKTCPFLPSCWHKHAKGGCLRFYNIDDGDLAYIIDFTYSKKDSLKKLREMRSIGSIFRSDF